MIEAIDMSLDDIIKNNKKSSATNTTFRGAARLRSRGHGRSRARDLELGPGPTRRSDYRSSTRSIPYLVPQVAV